jgi:hypothetical protein
MRISISGPIRSDSYFFIGKTLTFMTISNSFSKNLQDILLDSEGLEYADEYNDQAPILKVPKRTLRPKRGVSIVELNTNSDSAYQLATSASGHLMAVWRESDGMCYHMWANQYVPDQGWGAAIQIDSNNTDELFAPRIAMNSKGEAIVAWQQSGGTGNKIWANCHEPYKGWGVASLMTVDNVSDVSAVQIAIDDAGNAIALWRQFNGNATSIWSSRYESYCGWSTAKPISASCTGQAFDPQITMSASGHAIAVWTQSNSKSSHIWAKRYIAYEGWGRATQIDIGGVGKAIFPQALMDDNVDTIAAWHVFDGSKKSIWANNYSPDLGWREAKMIQTEYASWAFDPQASLNLGGGIARLAAIRPFLAKG